MKKIFTTLLLLGAAGAGSAQNFTEGNIVVARIGDLTPSTTTNRPVTLLEYNPSTQANTRIVNIPYTTTAPTSSETSLTVSINPAGSEGGMSLSADGKYLVIGGVNTQVGVTGENTGSTFKSFARVGYTGTPEVFVMNSNVNNGFIRSAASYDGSRLYFSSNQGLGLIPFNDKTTGLVRFNTINTGFIRTFNVIGNQLIGISSSNPAVLYSFGLPTAVSPQTAGTPLPGTDASNVGSAYGFTMLDTDPAVSNPLNACDVLYIADQGTTNSPATTSGIAKMYYDPGLAKWIFAGKITFENNASITGLTAKINTSGEIELYAVRGATLDNELIKITDNNPRNNFDIAQTTSPIIIATAGATYTFRSVALSPSQFSTLPLKLTSFKASSSGNNAFLKWTTNDEINVKEFVVEKSTDEANFHKVKVISAKNQSNNTYDLTDFNTEAGTIYYRLKMVDNDGAITFSNIETVSFKGSLGLNIYPNPATDYIKVNTSLVTAETTFEIVSIDGKLLKKGVLMTDELDISFLKSGLYLLKVGGESRLFTKK